MLRRLLILPSAEVRRRNRRELTRFRLFKLPAKLFKPGLQLLLGDFELADFLFSV